MELNFFPINIEFDKYQINIEGYTEERLNELRSLYNSTHSFFRNDEYIYISNKEGDENLQLGIPDERSVFDDAEVTSSLIKHTFFRTFKERFPNYTPIDFYPFRFFSEQLKDDIIYQALPDKLKNKIAYKKLIEIQLRHIKNNGVERFGFVINIRRNWIFNLSCLELNEEGYNLIGVEVLHAEILPGLQDILAPNEDFIGEIIEINGDSAKVGTNNGIEIYPLKELYIRKTKFNIGNYLSFATSQQISDSILNIIESRRSEVYNTKKHYEAINSIAKYIFSIKGELVLFQNKDGFCFTVDEKPLTVNNSIELKTPTFIYDYAGTKTNNTNADIGLSNFGPYDSPNFNPKAPSVLSICHRSNRGSFSNFLSSLHLGIPNSNYFKNGLLKKYDLHEISFDIQEIQDYNVEEYFKIIKNNDEYKPDLAIIEIPDSFKRLSDDQNPYYKIKAKLLALEIPVQYVTSRIINNYDQYILNSIALQIYAKIGGTPWVLPSSRSVDREIIIGIGHSKIRQNQFSGGNQERIVGITTFLSSDGQYLLGDKVKDVPFDDYFNELLKSLKNSIKRLSNEHGWSEGDTVRLIFHIFKPIKNTEFDVISQLIKDIPEYKIKFAFVTISKSHPYLLFDKNQPGIKKYGSSIVKGEYIPNRGSNVFLDDETCVVQMFGANELKTTKHGMSSPLQIKIRTPQGKYDDNSIKDLLFYDLNYITQQIFSFTYLSWRSFLPGEQPATMLYSNLISKLLGKMRKVQGWDPDSLNYGLKRKKWFL